VCVGGDGTDGTDGTDGNGVYKAAIVIISIAAAVLVRR